MISYLYHQATGWRTSTDESILIGLFGKDGHCINDAWIQIQITADQAKNFYSLIQEIKINIKLEEYPNLNSNYAIMKINADIYSELPAVIANQYKSYSLSDLAQFKLNKNSIVFNIAEQAKTYQLTQNIANNLIYTARQLNTIYYVHIYSVLADSNYDNNKIKTYLHSFDIIFNEKSYFKAILNYNIQHLNSTTETITQISYGGMEQNIPVLLNGLKPIERGYQYEFEYNNDVWSTAPPTQLFINNNQEKNINVRVSHDEQTEIFYSVVKINYPYNHTPKPEDAVYGFASSSYFWKAVTIEAKSDSNKYQVASWVINGKQYPPANPLTFILTPDLVNKDNQCLIEINLEFKTFTISGIGMETKSFTAENEQPKWPTTALNAPTVLTLKEWRDISTLETYTPNEAIPWQSMHVEPIFEIDNDNMYAIKNIDYNPLGYYTLASLSKDNRDIYAFTSTPLSDDNRPVSTVYSIYEEMDVKTFDTYFPENINLIPLEHATIIGAPLTVYNAEKKKANGYLYQKNERGVWKRVN